MKGSTTENKRKKKSTTHAAGQKTSWNEQVGTKGQGAKERRLPVRPTWEKKKKSPKKRKKTHRGKTEKSTEKPARKVHSPKKKLKTRRKLGVNTVKNKQKHNPKHR